MQEIHVAIVDDSLILRESLVDGMKQDIEINSIQDFNSIEDFLWKKKAGQDPNILLLDVNLPRINGIEAIDSILLRYPKINILIFSIFSDPKTIFQALSKGAVGYIHKSQQKIEEILEVIKTVHKGGGYLSPSITRHLLHLFRPSRAAYSKNHLTPREEQVLNGLLKGQTYQEIADDLILSIDTVRTHVKKIYGKVQVRNRTQLISKVRNVFNHFN